MSAHADQLVRPDPLRRHRVLLPGRYREPYDPAVVDILRRELDLDGTGRLLDVGTGTGNVVVPLAPLFEEAVGLDPDRDMLAQAAATALEAGVTTLRWAPATAEELPLGLGRFRLVTFAQSLHWMDRPRVFSTVYDMIDGGGAAVVVSQRKPEHDDADTTPWDDLRAVVRRYLGDERRAGSGTYCDPGPPQEAFYGSLGCRDVDLPQVARLHAHAACCALGTAARSPVSARLLALPPSCPPMTTTPCKHTIAVLSDSKLLAAHQEVRAAIAHGNHLDADQLAFVMRESGHSAR